MCSYTVPRVKYYPPEVIKSVPEGFLSQPLDTTGLPDTSYTLQVYVKSCTDCGLCVEARPMRPAR